MTTVSNVSVYMAGTIKDGNAAHSFLIKVRFENR